MSLATTIANAVEIARSVTASLQPTVRHLAWIGQDDEGRDQFALPVDRAALVEHKTAMVKGFDGQAVTARTYIAFLQPVPATAAIDPNRPRQNPIDPRDKIVLADMTSGPIVAISGFINAETDAPFLSEVWLGVSVFGRTV